MNNQTVSQEPETVASARTFVNREASQTRLIAGVTVPDGPLITSVIEHVYWENAGALGFGISR